MYEEVKVKLGQRLAANRMHKGMTQVGLAEASNLSVDQISKVEQGKRAPSLKTLDLLSTALQVPIKDFFDFEARFDWEIAEEQRRT